MTIGLRGTRDMDERMHRYAQPVAGVIAPPPLIAAGTVALGLFLDWLSQTFVLRVLFTSYQRIFLGLLLAAAGAALAIAAKRAFDGAATPVPPWLPTLHLATAGPYQWLRNPMYVGLGLITGGLGLALASDWTLALLVPAAILMHRGVVLREERYLEDKFGDAYRDYKDRVPRYGWPG